MIDSDKSVRDSNFASLREMRISLTSIVSVMLASVLFCKASVAAEPSTDATQVTSQLIELWQKIDTNLQTAQAQGRIIHSIEVRNRPGMLVTSEASVEIAYQNPKFKIRLREDVKRILNASGEWVEAEKSDDSVTFDGEKLFVLHLEKNGAVGTLYFDFSKSAVLRSIGFPFASPVQLWEKALQPTRMDPNRLSITKLGSGGIQGSLDYGRYVTRFYMLGEFGDELRRVASYRPGEPWPFRETVLSWGRSADVMFVRSFSTTQRFATEENPTVNPISEKLELRFDRFETNTEIDPATFALESLPIPAGTAIEDRRESTNGRAKQLEWNGQQLIEK